MPRGAETRPDRGDGAVVQHQDHEEQRQGAAEKRNGRNPVPARAALPEQPASEVDSRPVDSVDQRPEQQEERAAPVGIPAGEAPGDDQSGVQAGEMAGGQDAADGLGAADERRERERKRWRRT